MQPLAPGDVPVGPVAIGLIVLGLALTAPVSSALARARWTRREPQTALVLWQAVCLAAGFSVVSGLVLLAVEPLGSSVLQGAWLWFGAVLTGTLDLPAWRIACGVAALVISVSLLLVAGRTAALTVRRRRAHRRLVDLLSRPCDGLLPAGETDPRLRILDHASAVAYTLPGWHARVVLSAGLVDLLTPAELAAVIEHERAHLRARHDLLVLPFQAWAIALGWIPGVRRAGSSVAELTEVLADDVAAARTSRPALAAALAKVALSGRPATAVLAGTAPARAVPLGASAGPVEPSEARPPSSTYSVSTDEVGRHAVGRPPDTPAIGRTAVTARVQRLLDPQPLGALAVAAAYASSAVLLTIPASILLMRWI